MKKNNSYRGWIYCIRNKVNGKLYVGKTNNFTKRKYQHFHNETCPALKMAFAKYGIENFEMFEILTFAAVSNKVLNEFLNWFEIFYINKYGTYNNGYNCTKGGDGALGKSLSSITKEKIGNAQKVYKAQDWVKQKDRERMLGNTLSEKYKRPILRYTIDGVFMKEYSWIGDAIQDIIKDSKYTNNWRSIHSNIIRALASDSNKQHCNKAYDCMWKYKTSNLFEIFIDPFRRKKEKPVYHYSKEGELLEQYTTLREASVKTGMSVHTLKYLSYNGDLNRKKGKLCRKDYWSRTLIKEQYV